MTNRLIPFLLIGTSTFFLHTAFAETSSTNFPNLAQSCVPNAPISTIRAIVRAESDFQPYALSINHPHKTHLRLKRQPRSKEEALNWTQWLIQHHYTVSAGLMQINTQDANERGFSLDKLFEPCTNLKLGWQILTDKYRLSAAKYGPGQRALREALSLYNSGSPQLGFTNGYVARVLKGEELSQRTNRTHPNNNR